MSDLPWMKFYKDKYWRCTAVRALSPDTKSLWIDMLLVMVENPRSGFFQLGGRTPPLDAIARMCGTSTDRCSLMLQELQDSGLLDKTTDHVYFSPFMVAEMQKARLCSEAGKKGGNPTLNHTLKPTLKGRDKPQEIEVDRTKTERGDAGGSVRIPVAAVSATTAPDASEPVWAAMDAWAHRSRGKATDATHNEHAPIRMAIASWEQEPDYPTGVPWNTAVCRCIRAAMGSGTKFGDSPRYAIRVVNGLLSAWRQGTPPEPPASSVSGPRFVPDDEAAAQEARLRVQREAKAKAKQNGVHK